MTGYTGFYADPIVVMFDDGARKVPAHMISRFWEGEYHYVREPIPMDGYEFLQDTYGLWSAVERNAK